MSKRHLLFIVLFTLAAFVPRQGLSATPPLEAVPCREQVESQNENRHENESRHRPPHSRRNAVLLSGRGQLLTGPMGLHIDGLAGYERAISVSHSLSVHAGAGGGFSEGTFITVVDFELRHNYFFAQNDAQGFYVGDLIRLSWLVHPDADARLLTQFGPRLGYSWPTRRFVRRAEIGVAITAPEIELRPFLGATIGWRF